MSSIRRDGRTMGPFLDVNKEMPPEVFIPERAFMVTFKEIKSIYWSYGGRINRARFCLANLPTLFILLIAFPVTKELANSSDRAESVMSRQHGELLPLAVVFCLLISLALIACVFGICLQVKRFHDFDCSGWYSLLPLYPTSILWSSLSFCSILAPLAQTVSVIGTTIKAWKQAV